MLNAADFEEVRLARAIPRGGLFTTRPSLRLSAAATARRFPLEEGAAGFGGALVLGFEPIPQLLPTLRLQVVAAPDAGVSKDYLEASALLGIGWRKPLGAVALRLEVATGYEHLFQSDGHTSGLAWQGIAGLDIPFSNLFLRLDVAAGGRLFTLKETDDLQHRLDLQATLGLGWQLDL